MYKIVLIANQAEADNGLSILIKALFPECEVVTVPPGTESFESSLTGCSPELLYADPGAGNTFKISDH